MSSAGMPSRQPFAPVAGERSREHLAAYMRAWGRHRVHFGASGVVRHPPEEYAGVFDTVCIDAESSLLAGGATLARMNERIPPGFVFTVSVADEPMMYRFPYGYSDAAKRGELNDRFLDAGTIGERIAPVADRLASRIGLVVLAVAPVYRTEALSFGVFLGKLAGCLDALPRRCRYAVEIGNPEFLQPEYLACLRERNVAHVLGNARGMPSLLDQAQVPGVFTADVAVLRTVDDAEGAAGVPLAGVRRISGPMDAEQQLGIVEAVRRCVEEKRELYVYLSDREGVSVRRPAPVLIADLMTVLDADLAKLSPMRKRAPALSGRAA